MIDGFDESGFDDRRLRMTRDLMTKGFDDRRLRDL